MSVVISWKESGVVVVDPVSFGELEALDVSTPKILTLQHDSSKPVVNCSLFLSPAGVDYSGSRYASRDFDQLIWYADNYPGYGLSLIQTYTVFGEVEAYDADKIVDSTRFEQTDVFAGSTLEILDGPYAGATTEIDSFNVLSTYFVPVTPFPGNVTGAKYRIVVTKEDIIKTGNGASIENPIALLNRAGSINRNEIVELQLTLSVPKFVHSASKLHTNFNMLYFPTEG